MPVRAPRPQKPETSNAGTRSGPNALPQDKGEDDSRETLSERMRSRLHEMCKKADIP